MEGKSSSQNAEIEHFLSFCQLIMSDVGESVRCSDREIFLTPKFSRFPAECDPDSKVSQNARNLGFR